MQLDAGPAAAGEEEDEGAALGADNDDDDASLGSDDDSLLAPSEDEDDDGDLGFDDDEEDDEEPGSSSKAQRTRVLTSETLQKWQSSILEVRCLPCSLSSDARAEPRWIECAVSLASHAQGYARRVPLCRDDQH